MKETSTGTRIFLALFRPIQRLPLGFHYFWGSVFSFVAEKVLHYRRDVVVANLARSFPHKRYGEIKALAHDFYGHLGEIFAEAMWFGGNHGRPDRCRKQGICRIINTVEVQEALERSGNVMVLDSHFGNWELTGGFFQYVYDTPEGGLRIGKDNIIVVYKRLRSRFWDGFMRENRCAALPADFQGYTESMEVLRYALGHREEKKIYVFPTDQYPYAGTKSCDVPSFMNQPTKAMVGGAALARKFGMPVYYMSMDRIAKGKYEVTFKKVCDDASAFAPGQIMEKYYALLQEDVVRNPANYLWSHRRWKCL